MGLFTANYREKKTDLKKIKKTDFRVFKNH